VEKVPGTGAGHGSVAPRIEVVPYDPRWPGEFEAERVQLERVLGPWLEDGIHHVGSTAIPGIAAKPIVDMMAGVRDFEDARAAYAPLLAAGWEHTPHRPGIAHHFSKGETHGLHLTEPGSDLWLERLAFRDRLRADASLAREYEALKLRLAGEAGDLGGYTAGKREFVARVLTLDGLRPGRR
jgi:GrpB-like predicted nucleotidyltransferase (UPF0157 family)